MVHEGLQQASRRELGALELAPLFERLKMAFELTRRRNNAAGEGSDFDLGALRQGFVGPHDTAFYSTTHPQTLAERAEAGIVLADAGPTSGILQMQFLQ